MTISVLELFTIGVGPSSSHTVGPMRAAKKFIDAHTAEQLKKIHRIKVDLFGSLALTGKGHGTDKAILVGLLGAVPECVDPDDMDLQIKKIKEERKLQLPNAAKIDFLKEDLLFHYKEFLDFHPNGVRFISTDDAGKEVLLKEYYSVGGGFIKEAEADGIKEHIEDAPKLPYPFSTGFELLALTEETGLSISSIVLENESFWRPEAETRKALLKIWDAMASCIKRGCTKEGVLPGGLKVKRRAAALYRKIKASDSFDKDPLKAMDWVNLYALAVNEENAAGGRVVTAPTNGAAGIIPAVLFYYRRILGDESEEAVVRFLLTAAAIGMLYKKNASLSGAEVGCQGEVGVACSMAAGGLAEVLGGTPSQVENAAEIGMEHNLGLTCDPIGGLVQIPCIERNAMASIKAINAAKLALRGDGRHTVHLDKVIKTMYQTGADMAHKYKETSQGGLAVSVPEC